MCIKLHNRKRILIFALLMLALTLLTGCAEEKDSEILFKTKEDFIGRRIADISGSANAMLIEEEYGDIVIKYYDDVAGEIEALNKGDIDALSIDYPTGKVALEERPECAFFPENFVNVDYVFYLKKGNPLCQEISAVIDELREDGYLDKLADKWIEGTDADRVLDLSDYNMEDRGNGVINFYFQNEGMPIVYSGEGGKPMGYEVELMLEVADRLNMGIEITAVKLTSAMMALEQGKCDVCGGGFAYTEERVKTMAVTSPTYVSKIMMLTKREYIDPELLDSEITETGDQNIIERARTGLYRTFIEENRWQMILKGLGVTMLITSISVILGFILGIILCQLRLRGSKTVQKICEGFCDVITGTPSLVILLIVYFIVFASSSMDPIISGIVTFTVIFMVSISGITKSGMLAIDNGQYEAAYSLGFSRTQTSRYIIVPQTFSNVFSLYIGEAISLMKSTSIVGYIAIQDLTKVGDLIRSRTFQAFAPLVSVALIYYLVSKLLIYFLGKCAGYLNPVHNSGFLCKGINKDIRIDMPKVVDYSPSDEEMIRMEHLRKEFPQATPVKDVNAVVRRGDSVAIIGPSGTGKSTLLRMINRMDTPTSGKVYVLGQDNTDSDTNLLELRQKVGMVFQSYNLFANYSVIENVMLAPVLLQKRDKQEVYDFAMKLLYSVGMAGRADNMPAILSGGQKQRVAIARALAMKPEIMLFDEPTSALDPGMVDGVMSVIQGLADQGMTMLTVTHEMNFARKISNRVFYMDQGELYEEGTPEQIFDHPQRNRTRAFIEKMNTLAIRITGEDYDAFELSSQIDKFAKERKIDFGKADALKETLNAVLKLGVIPHDEAEPRLTVLLEANETKLLYKLIREGEKFDQIEPKLKKLMNKFEDKVESYSYTYEDGRNEIEIVIR